MPKKEEVAGQEERAAKEKAKKQVLLRLSPKLWNELADWAILFRKLFNCHIDHSYSTLYNFLSCCNDSYRLLSLKIWLIYLEVRKHDHQYKLFKPRTNHCNFFCPSFFIIWSDCVGVFLFCFF